MRILVALLAGLFSVATLAAVETKEVTYAGGGAEIGYRFFKLPFVPRLSYSPRYFSGDDPGTTGTLERFDPLILARGAGALVLAMPVPSFQAVLAGRIRVAICPGALRAASMAAAPSAATSLALGEVFTQQVEV